MSGEQRWHGREMENKKVESKFVFNFHNLLLDFYHFALLSEIIDFFPPAVFSC